MARCMKRQRDGDGEVEELRGHCVFYSYRPLAPSVGWNPEQRGLQSSPNSPVTKQERAETETETGKWDADEGRGWNAKPDILHVLQWNHKGAPPVFLSLFNLSTARASSPCLRAVWSGEGAGSFKQRMLGVWGPGGRCLPCETHKCVL